MVGNKHKKVVRIWSKTHWPFVFRMQRLNAVLFLLTADKGLVDI